MRIFCFLTLFVASLFAHGIFYEIKEGNAVIFNISFSQTAQAKFAKVTIYKGESAIPFLESNADENGVFAFVPQKKGEYRAVVSATSDHGEHLREFKFTIDKNLTISKYDKPLFERYAGILSAIGILFGIFGILSLVKSRKRA